MAKKLGYKACFNRLEKAVIKWGQENGHDADLFAYGTDVETDTHHTWVFSTSDEANDEYRATVDRATGKTSVTRYK